MKFFSKKRLAFVYDQERLSEVLGMEINDKDFKEILDAWNETIAMQDTELMDEFVHDWFTEHFALKVIRKK